MNQELIKQALIQKLAEAMTKQELKKVFAFYGGEVKEDKIAFEHEKLVKALIKNVSKEKILSRKHEVK